MEDNLCELTGPPQARLEEVFQLNSAGIPSVLPICKGLLETEILTGTLPPTSALVAELNSFSFVLRRSVARILPRLCFHSPYVSTPGRQSWAPDLRGTWECLSVSFRVVSPLASLPLTCQLAPLLPLSTLTESSALNLYTQLEGRVSPPSPSSLAPVPSSLFSRISQRSY